MSDKNRWQLAAANGVAQITALRDECDELRAEVERLREALVSIEEYWNGAPEAAVDAAEEMRSRARIALNEGTTND